ncbi:MAG: HAD family hydrolase [Victivallaceae bacterium]|nr:HAD family hydrolase [Victivallaceae bacterium]
MIRGLFFDLNGTVIDILTNEWDDQTYRVTANFLSYSHVDIAPEQLREEYAKLNRRQRHDSEETYPEFDVGAIFEDIILRYHTDGDTGRDLTSTHALAEIVATVFRAASRFQLRLYPGVTAILDKLRTDYRMIAVSDGQELWARPEMRSLGLEPYFETLLISSTFGYRKPDRRMFEMGLRELDMSASEVLFIGNDMYRDVYGAAQLGIRTVFFKSNQGDQMPHGAEPDYIIYNFEELPKAIRFLEHRG